MSRRPRPEPVDAPTPEISPEPDLGAISSPAPTADAVASPAHAAHGVDPTDPEPNRESVTDEVWSARFHGWTLSDIAGLVVALCCSVFVFVQLRPDLLFTNTTPAGGDMGAHVWAPAYLRDHLLPQGRLSGWTPDWYAGFPLYHFYMVIPPLMILAVNGGLPLLVGIPLGLALVAGTAVVTRGASLRRRIVLLLLAVLVAVLLIPVPYGIAFKLVTVTGVVLFPLAVWAMARLARASEPIPAFAAMVALFFLFDTNFTIYGGNIASTLAGEFSFAISLSLTMVALGVAVRGMDTDRLRVPAALLIALVALTHVLPVFFAVAALIALVVMGPSTPRLWSVIIGVALVLIPVALAEGTARIVLALAILGAVVVMAAAMMAQPEVMDRARWLAVTGPVAAAIAGFWLLPFMFRGAYFNDMGWERVEHIGPDLLTVPMKIALPLAAVGALVSFANRERLGMLFTITAAVAAAAVANVGQGAVWNVRLLPYYYLSVYLVAAIGAAYVVRFVGVTISEAWERPDPRVILAATGVALVAGLTAVGLPLRNLPGGQDRPDGTYEWMGLVSHERSFVPGWTEWNYSGYEGKDAYAEYHAVVQAMDSIGETNGCGRAFWEYDEDRLDRYGTPMALMLLPFWTDGCIGSMEGLYFESSATTPFHYLNQSMLSANPSRSQRKLPYSGFDIERGVEQLQTMGVRYYMAQSDLAIEAARDHPDLTEMSPEAQPFVIFEVAGSELVQGLGVEPVVTSGLTEDGVGELGSRFDWGWLGQAVTFYNDPGGYEALPAESGPDNWQRATTLTQVEGRAVEPVVVSDVQAGTSNISFTVDEVGSPVLVKASYFPNWEVSGADGPWRAGPNLMVVVPTDNEVELSFGRTPIDWLAILVTLVGLTSLFGLYKLDHQRWPRVPDALGGILGRSAPRPGGGRT